MTTTTRCDLAATADLWWKNAVIYCLDVQTFADSDGDGIGDFAGLTQQVDYLAGLGVTCIWLMPFYPTADRDDGYDITDHYAIDPRLGHVRRLHRVHAHVARDRGHAGDRRPRRQPHLRPAPVVPGGPPQPRVAVPRLLRLAATRSPPTARRAWSSPATRTASGPTTPRPASTTCTASTATSPTSTSPSAAVRDEIRKVIGFWLAQGLSGFRVDAVPFLLETDGHRRTRWSSTRTSTCATCGRSSAGAVGEAILLGEVNLPADEQRRFFGDEDGDELHMLFDFHRHAGDLPGAGPRRRPAARSARCAGARRSPTRRRGPRSCATTTS